MPEGGADVVDCVGADLDQPHFSKPVHIGPTPMGTSVLVQTWVADPFERRRRAIRRAFMHVSL
jgi:hypothetical protein